LRPSDVLHGGRDAHRLIKVDRAAGGGLAGRQKGEAPRAPGMICVRSPTRTSPSVSQPKGTRPPSAGWFRSSST
jgi:hypothetical protein